MKRPLLLAAAAACSVLFSSCGTTTVAGRINKHPGMYNALSSSHQTAVQEGRLKKGMSKDATYLSWGRPNSVRDTSSGEKWRYVSTRPVLTHSVGYSHGYHSGRYGSYCGPYYDIGPTVHYVPYTSAVVEFRHGKVTGWERER